MPESIRSLLHDIADDGSEPTRDLAAGAYRRARGIARRRFAIGAVSVVTALALGGAGTAGLLDRDRVPSPADPTTTEATPDDPETSEETDEGAGCNVGVADWEGLGYEFPARGESEADRTLTEIPDEILLRGEGETGEPATLAVRGGEPSLLDDAGDYLYYPAPDGNRTLAVNKSDWCSGAYFELNDAEFEAQPVFSFSVTACPITWSPDSNRVLFTEAGGTADEQSYVLDVSTGEVTELPEELYCTAKWLPDSEHLWDNQGTVMHYDGTALDTVPVITQASEFEYLIASGMSADRGESCLHQTEGDSPGWRCDRYFDMETGDEIDLPVVGGRDDGATRQVEFLEDGSMLILEQTASAATLYLVGPDGELADELELPEAVVPEHSELELLSWFTG